MKKIIYVLTLFFTLLISFNASAQDILKSKDLSTVKVDYLSDDDLAKISAQLKSNNATIDQVESMALSKGMNQTEFNKLKMKLTEFEKKNSKDASKDKNKDNKIKTEDLNNSLNKKVIQISSNKNNLSEEELNKIIDNARQMDEIDRIDKYKKESYLQLKENCKRILH